MLKKCNTISIKVNVHTDNRGTKSYNQILSLKRAKVIRSYLIQNGIAAKRIQAFGYGESQLLNKCRYGIRCTEKEHRVNRRAEFEIIKE